MDIVVLGGGCYGTLHARQLLKAWQRGRLDCDRLVVVDHNDAPRARQEFTGEPLVELVTADWGAFLERYLRTCHPGSDACVVPAPYQPHLFFDWLLGCVRTERPGSRPRREPLRDDFGLPYEHLDGAGNRFLSWAAWTCPVTCIEPATCPVLRQPRSWDLRDTLLRRPGVVASLAGVEVFTCHHLAFGIGATPVRQLLEARERVVAAAAAGPQRTLVATVSRCHGVATLLASG